MSTFPQLPQKNNNKNRWLRPSSEVIARKTGECHRKSCQEKGNTFPAKAGCSLGTCYWPSQCEKMVQDEGHYPWTAGWSRWKHEGCGLCQNFDGQVCVIELYCEYACVYFNSWKTHILTIWSIMSVMSTLCQDYSLPFYIWTRPDKTDQSSSNVYNILAI